MSYPGRRQCEREHTNKNVNICENTAQSYRNRKQLQTELCLKLYDYPTNQLITLRPAKYQLSNFKTPSPNHSPICPVPANLSSAIFYLPFCFLISSSILRYTRYFIYCPYICLFDI